MLQTSCAPGLEDSSLFRILRACMHSPAAWAEGAQVVLNHFALLALEVGQQPRSRRRLVLREHVQRDQLLNCVAMWVGGSVCGCGCGSV